MRNVVTAIFLLITTGLSAQVLPSYYDTLERHHEIVINGTLDYSSSAIQKAITGKFIRGGFIDEGIKDASFDRHGAVNRIGLDASADIIYTNYKARIFKNRPWGYQVKAGYYNFGGVLYSKDLFGMTFYGNSRYVGDTIQMSGTDVSFMSFQKVGFGLIHSTYKSSVTLNFYNISNRMSGDFRTLEVIQDASGDVVTLNMDGDVELRNNLNFIQGLGAGVDVDYKLAIDLGEDKKAFVQFKADNIGFAYLNQSQKTYNFDTTFVYSGLRFEEIMGDNAILNDSLDVLDTLGISSGETKRTVMLPGVIQIAKIVDAHETKKLQSFFGLRLYPTLIYNPYVFAGVDFKPVEKLNLGASVGYGGFAKFRGGFYASYRANKFSVGLGTENLIGMISQRGSGESVYLRLGCAF
jgi:hypothetical protein